MKPPPLFLSLTLTFWLGLYALRSYVPAAVWNLADEMPLSMKPLLAVGVNVVGIAGIALFYKARRHALVPLAVLFAAALLARQIFNTIDAVEPWLALVSWACWIWFMAALAQETAAHDAEPMVVPALAAAAALQLGMQSAWHGLDLHAVSGILPAALIFILAATLCLSVTRISPGGTPRARTSAMWLLLGPALFLVATLSGNAGRISELTGWDLPAAIAAIQAALLLAVVFSERSIQVAPRFLVVAAGTIAVFASARLNGALALLILVVLPVIMAGLCVLVGRRVKWSARISIALTLTIFFGLIFGFYQAYESTLLWIIAFLPFGFAAGLGKTPTQRFNVVVFTPFALAALFTLLYFVPPPGDAAARDSSTVGVLTFNIHQGFDDGGVPGMPETAQQIAALSPALVALQEIGRGWTLLGGNDLVAYLRWRFPEYTVIYAPTNGRLWGNAIMSRLPVLAATSGTFAAEPGVFRYGWIQAMVAGADGHLEFYSVHLTADIEARGGDDRLTQARRLVARVGEAPRVIVAGDLNASPHEAPIAAMRAALTDLGALAGLADNATWPAGEPRQRIDYIFARGFAAVRGIVPRTAASDHLPVFIQAESDATPPASPPSNRSFQPRIPL